MNSADSSFKYIDANVASDIAYAILTTCLFLCSNAIRNGNIYLIGNDGGEPQAIVGDGKSESPDWSSDGNTLMFWTSRDHELQVANFLDLRTGKRSAVGASVGMLGAHWIGNDQLIAAEMDSAGTCWDYKWEVEPDDKMGRFAGRQISVLHDGRSQS